METQNYLDCELHIIDDDQATFKVASQPEPLSYPGKVVLDDKLYHDLGTPLDAKEYGIRLFKAVFLPEEKLTRGYRNAWETALKENKRLRFRLHMDFNAPPHFRDFKWELLYDPEEKTALGRSPKTVFSRLPGLLPQVGSPISGRPKLLIVISSPTNLVTKYKLDTIDREKTRQTIEKALAPLSWQLDYEFLEGHTTASKLRERLLSGQFHALHIQAHGFLEAGKESAGILLELDDGQGDIVDEDYFSEVFEGNPSLRLVTLICCHSGAQTGSDPFGGLGPALVRRGIPAVIAMRQDISMQAADCFIRNFYGHLAKSGEVDVAANEARQQLYLPPLRSLEWDTPVLFMRLTDGRLWKARERPGTITSPSSIDWDDIIEKINSDKVVPFLGPDMKRGLLALDAEIAIRWAGEHEYPFDRCNDLPRVAQYIETIEEEDFFPHKALRRIQNEMLLHPKKSKDQNWTEMLDSPMSKVLEQEADRYFREDEHESHRILAKLPFSIYITTNYDSFMKTALKAEHRNPQQVCSPWRDEFVDDLDSDDRYKNLQGTIKAPLVFHLYGIDDTPQSIVLTEDDYLHFLESISMEPKHVVPEKLRGKLTDSRLLFLGYDLTTLDCRILFRGLIMHLRPKKVKPRIAVFQISPKENDDLQMNNIQEFIEKYCKYIDIQIYWGTLRDFLIELYDHWEKKYGSQ